VWLLRITSETRPGSLPAMIRAKDEVLLAGVTRTVQPWLTKHFICQKLGQSMWREQGMGWYAVMGEQSVRDPMLEGPVV
jgi:hypothetical protein